MSEATLCEKHFVQPYIDYANYDADAADDVSTDRQWYDSSGNDVVRCFECRLDDEAERLDAERGLA